MFEQFTNFITTCLDSMDQKLYCKKDMMLFIITFEVTEMKINKL